MNKIKVTISKLRDGIYQLATSEATATRGLSSTQFDEFSIDKEFAGISKRGNLLSQPGTNTRAEISGLPMFATPDDTWQACNYRVLLRTAKPELIVSVHAYAHGDPYVLVKKTDLLDRYEIALTYYSKDQFPGKEYITTEKLDQALDFRAAHPEATIAQNSSTFYVLFPKNKEYNTAEWASLDRHIFTGKPAAPFTDTVPIQYSTGFKIPGTVADIACSNYGVQGNPNAFQNGKLSFSQLEIIDPVKARKLHPALAKLHSINSHCTGFNGSISVDMEEVLLNPKLCAKLVTCDAEFKRVRVTADAVCTLLDYPLLGPVIPNEEPQALIFSDGTQISYQKNPAAEKASTDFAEKFFVPVTKICRTHKLESDVVRYNLRYGHRLFLPGKWVLKSVLAKIPARNGKQERQTKQARIQKLESQYGPLPKGIHLKTDEEVKQYFNIQQGIQTGTLIELQESTLLPSFCLHQNSFKTWLTAAGHIFRCPMTETEYVTNFRSIDDLVKLPDFLETLQSTFNEDEWLLRLLASPAAQTLAISTLL